MKVEATTANKQNQSRAVANNVSKQKSNSRNELGVVDNRPETNALKNLQMMIYVSPRMAAQQQRTLNITSGTAQVIKGPDTNVPNGPAESSKFIRLYAPSPVSLYAKALKSTERNKSKAIANNVGGRSRGIRRGFGFVDNRAEAVAQQKLHNMALNSPQPHCVAQLQDELNTKEIVQLKRVSHLTRVTRKNKKEPWRSTTP